MSKILIKVINSCNDCPYSYYREWSDVGVCGVSIDDYEVVGNIFEGITNASG